MPAARIAGASLSLPPTANPPPPSTCPSGRRSRAAWATRAARQEAPPAQGPRRGDRSGPTVLYTHTLPTTTRHNAGSTARAAQHLVVTLGVVEGPPLGVWPVRRGASERAVRIMSAVFVLTAVTSAALLLWLAAGDGGGSRSYRGIEASCIARLEDGGGDTSICDRAPAGALANVVGQLTLAVVGGVLALRLRQPLLWLRATVAVSVALTVICYVFMRSWQFGLDQPLM